MSKQFSNISKVNELVKMKANESTLSYLNLHESNFIQFIFHFILVVMVKGFELLRNSNIVA